jgi:hypothetical protein
VEFSSADTSEHRPVRIAVGGLLLQFGNILDILKFRLSLSIFFATQSAQGVSRLVSSASLDEPSGGLREEPDDAEKEEQWDNLESN